MWNGVGYGTHVSGAVNRQGFKHVVVFDVRPCVISVLKLILSSWGDTAIDTVHWVFASMGRDANIQALVLDRIISIGLLVDRRCPCWTCVSSCILLVDCIIMTIRLHCLTS